MLEVGILKTWDSVNYRAGVQLAGSLTTYFDNINVARNIPSSAMVLGNYVIIATPNDNPKDACLIAAWPSGSGTPYTLLSGVKITAGRPYMTQEAEEQIWVYASTGHHYYFNTETGEITLKEDT